MSEERRVRRVKLAAGSRGLVQRGAVLLEDALRTASLPQAPGGRVLVIRRLALGAIHADRSPAALSLVLEQRVREVAMHAVPVSSQAAVSAQAVYFRDALEPFEVLATRLALGLPVDAWFWPLAIPGLRPGMPRDEALRLALSGALRTQPGPAAAVMLICELEARGAVEPMLGALRWQDGPALARAWWGHLPSRPAPLLGRSNGGALEHVAEPLRSTLARWIRTWGAGDARGLWLAAVGLCTRRPSRVTAPDLASRAWWVAAALQEVPPAQGATLREVARRETPETELRFTTTPAQPDAPAPRSSPRAPAAAPPPFSPGSASMDAASSAPVSPAQSLQARRPEERLGSTSTVETAGDIGPSPEETAPYSMRDEALPTAAGGLLFLVPMMNALGIEEFLAGHPALAELGAPERLLCHVAERLGVPTTDPLLRVLQAAAGEPFPDPSPFVLPTRFQKAAGAQPPFHIVRDTRGRCVAFDARRRVPLAVLSPGVTLPPPFNVGSVTVAAPPLRWDDATLLRRAAWLAVCRVTRLLTGMRLKALVLRPGRLVATRTHLDIVFAASQVDIRIRRAGLDINPGWVPWLARVIQYHYAYDEAEA